MRRDQRLDGVGLNDDSARTGGARDIGRLKTLYEKRREARDVRPRSWGAPEAFARRAGLSRGRDTLRRKSAIRCSFWPTNRLGLMRKEMKLEAEPGHSRGTVRRASSESTPALTPAWLARSCQTATLLDGVNQKDAAAAERKLGEAPAGACKSPGPRRPSRPPKDCLDSAG